MENIKDNIFLVLSNIDDYLDISLGTNTDQKFKEIVDLKRDLKLRSSFMNMVEYTKEDTEIFYKFLKLKGLV